MWGYRAARVLRGIGPAVSGRRSLTVLAAAVTLLVMPTVALAGASGGGPTGAGGSAPVGALAACVAGVPSDFNGDGVADIAIGDPDATVSGQAGAGRVHVVYGAGKGSQTVSQAELYVDGEPEPGDRFGFALAAYDANADGCADLAISAPYEALGTVPEGGNVQVLYGSPTGFGAAGGAYYSQNQSDMPDTGEAGDRFSYSLAAGTTAAGAAYLVIGVPGEDLFNSSNIASPDAGGFGYVSGTTKLFLHQDSSAVPGVVEAHGQFGYAVAATLDHVAVSGPGEAIGTEAYSGAVTMFNHTVGSGVLGVVGSADQDMAGQSGGAESGDFYGRALSMVSYLPAAGGARRSLLAVGSAGEGIGTPSKDDAGRTVLFDLTTTVTETLDLHQGLDGVAGAIEPSDYFGASVQLVNRTPGSPATWQNLLLAAGIPGEDTTAGVDDGSVEVFSMVGPPGDHDVAAENALAAAGWSAKSGGTLGRYLGASATHLYLADPYGTSPAVYAVPWRNLTDGATDPVVVYAPGRDGLPTDGVGRFGAAIA